MRVTENILDGWVRANSRDAQGIIVDLIFRLVCASTPNPIERRFPLRDSIGQPGPDGVLETNIDFNPFVPKGKSYWEIGTSEKAGDKAASDYRELTKVIDEDERLHSTFIFVTPLSARKDWQYTWKENAQITWINKKRKLNEWRNIFVIDGTKLIDWLGHFPAVELWLIGEMGHPIDNIQIPEQRWENLRCIGEPPFLNPALFINNRSEAGKKLNEILMGDSIRLKIDTRFSNQMADFVAAYIATLDKKVRVDITSRCVIISSQNAWNSIASLRDKHILIADFDLNDTESSGMLLLEQAKRGGHAVIFGGLPGGIPGLNRVNLPSPTIYQIEQALVQSGYTEQRARNLSQKSSGNINSLLRCLQSLSLSPQWAQENEAANLVIAELLGRWNEEIEGDQKIIEILSGKLYGEWIGIMRNLLLKSDIPLIHREGNWKFVTRYEAWYMLGPRVFNEQLDLFQNLAIDVLQELDPQFELAAPHRYMANIMGRNFSYSNGLRIGIVESLALLGNHSKALSSCSPNKGEQIAQGVVRTILKDNDWVTWASLNNQLPLLAEAAPNQFLNAVELALSNDCCPLDNLFNQESAGITGANYLTGLLWALETLAWEAKYLVRSILILGELAAKDPGGNWANRPINSLKTILLPWYPQTCANIATRKAAVSALVQEIPEIGWSLILNLLPKVHTITTGTRKPVWRESISDGWKQDVSHKTYFDQVNNYTEIAIDLAKRNVNKLCDLTSRLADLALAAQNQLLAYLSSTDVIQFSQSERFLIWNVLVDLITKHRRFSETDWALPTMQVDKMETVADYISPTDGFYRHQRLFNTRNSTYFESEGSYEEKYKKLNELRKNAILDVFSNNNLEVIISFSDQVDSPAYVGIALAEIYTLELDSTILLNLIQQLQEARSLFIGGYISTRFRIKGWNWIDRLDLSTWAPEYVGKLLAYLPFHSDTWQRVEKMLADNESTYWIKANVTPYESSQELSYAIDKLIQYDRSYEAIYCLWFLMHQKLSFDIKQAVKVIIALSQSLKTPNNMDFHYLSEVIQSLQNTDNIDLDDIYLVEWLMLPTMNRQGEVRPKFLMQRLANDSGFFCDTISAIYRSEKFPESSKEIVKQQESFNRRAYNLLNEWHTPPGTEKDGSFQGDKLVSWLDEVKDRCFENGHLEIALSNIGKVLVYSPVDPKGLWIHQDVAIILNAKDAQSMRNGFFSQLLNSRGVYWSTAGKEEIQLAQKYELQALQLEEYGFHRLASTLKEVSAVYEKDSLREAEEDLNDEWRN